MIENFVFFKQVWHKTLRQKKYLKGRKFDGILILRMTEIIFIAGVNLHFNKFWRFCGSLFSLFIKFWKKISENFGFFVIKLKGWTRKNSLKIWFRKEFNFADWWFFQILWVDNFFNFDVFGKNCGFLKTTYRKINFASLSIW